MMEENNMHVEKSSEHVKDAQAAIQTNGKEDGFLTIFKEPARLVIFIVSVVLSIVLIVLGARLNSINSRRNSYTSYSTSSSISTSGTLYANSANNVYLSTTHKYYKFTPTSSGYYDIYSSVSSTTIDPAVSLRDSSNSYLASNDNSRDGTNFYLTYYLYSGNTYYLDVYSSTYSGNATIYIYLT